MKAIWNGKIIAESDETIVVEGNHYFPPDAVQPEYLKKNDHHTTCFWKGQASYFDLIVDTRINQNAAWTYPDPSEAASNIKGYIAFWRGVEVTE